MTETMTISNTGGMKGEKPSRFDLIPVKALTALAEHYGKLGGDGTPGTQKYDARNWELGFEFHKSYAAAIRHLTEFWAGNDIDSPSSSHHLIAAAWHCLTLYTFATNELYANLDDRPRRDE